MSTVGQRTSRSVTSAVPAVLAIALFLFLLAPGTALAAESSPKEVCSPTGADLSQRSYFAEGLLAAAQAIADMDRPGCVDLALPSSSDRSGSRYRSPTSGPRLARPPPATAVTYSYDSAPNSADPVEDLRRVRRASPGLGADRYAPNGPRGLSPLGGVIEQTGTNCAGGRIFTSTGPINQSDFAGIVQSGVARGDDVHIFIGAHGLADGSMLTDTSVLVDDVKKFGELPGV